MTDLKAQLKATKEVLELSRELVSTVALEPLLRKIVEVATQLIDCESTALLLLSDDESELRFVASNYIADQLADIRVPIDASIAGAAFRQGSPIIVPDTDADPRYFRGVEQETGYRARSLLAVPLQFKDRRIGVLEAENKSHDAQFTEFDAEVLTTLAAYATVAIENARTVRALWTTREALERRIVEHERLYSQAQQEIARRREVERELQRHRDQLEDMVATRTSELQQANRQLQQEIEDRKRIEDTLRRYADQLEISNEELDAFTYTVAHDLKGPLGMITGYVGVALTDDSGEDIPKALQAISRGSDKMYRIIEELLLLADVRRRDEVLIEPLDMAAIVAEAIDRLDHVIVEYQAEIAMPQVWPSALGYAPWVEEVWVNYLSNALKYGGRPPLIELGATVEPDGRVRFWTSDNGAGLTPEEQARMFTPFTRLAPDRAKGYGLGLSIVERIVERLGGDTAVESQVGEGSTFSFFLPAVP